jgi:hypothetical protein
VPRPKAPDAPPLAPPRLPPPPPAAPRVARPSVVPSPSPAHSNGRAAPDLSKLPPAIRESLAKLAGEPSPTESPAPTLQPPSDSTGQDR